MIVAQQLYEAGLITYHRTDSVNISDTAIQEVRDLITKIGSEYLPSKPIIYKSRENAQEAHEGIRPSHLEHTLDDVKNQVNAEQFKLYDVIFRRFVSCQMTDAKFNATKIVIESDDKKHNFIANGNILSFDGFLLVWTYTDSKDLILPTVSKNGKLSLIDVNGIQHFTKPPAQYNDASLIKYLEEKGVGRPSTYASIIDTLKKRGYVEKKGKALVPTEIAFKVSDFLVANFPELMNIDYTARVESDLDEIANAKKVWHEAVGEFYCELKKRLDAVKASDRPASFAEVTKIVCPQCQRNMLVKRKGKFGEFYGCSGYKASRDGKKDKNFCDATFKIGENGDPVRGQTKPVEVFDKRKCDCGAKLLIRTAKKTGDKFVGCSRFPMCRNVYSIQGVKIERDN
jgi:DNA topoisomerase-1